jgi:hypothetical protein
VDNTTRTKKIQVYHQTDILEAVLKIVGLQSLLEQHTLVDHQYHPMYHELNDLFQ